MKKLQNVDSTKDESLKCVDLQDVQYTKNYENNYGSL